MEKRAIYLERAEAPETLLRMAPVDEVVACEIEQLVKQAYQLGRTDQAEIMEREITAALRKTISDART